MHLADNASGNVSELILKLQAQRRAIAAAAAATDRILEEIAVSILVPRPARAAGGHGVVGGRGVNGACPKGGTRAGRKAAGGGRPKAAGAGRAAAKPALPNLGRLWAGIV